MTSIPLPNWEPSSPKLATPAEGYAAWQESIYADGEEIARISEDGAEMTILGDDGNVATSFATRRDSEAFLIESERKETAGAWWSPVHGLHIHGGMDDGDIHMACVDVAPRTETTKAERTIPEHVDLDLTKLDGLIDDFLGTRGCTLWGEQWTITDRRGRANAHAFLRSAIHDILFPQE